MESGLNDGMCVPDCLGALCFRIGRGGSRQWAYCSLYCRIGSGEYSQRGLPECVGIWRGGRSTSDSFCFSAVWNSHGLVCPSASHLANGDLCLPKPYRCARSGGCGLAIREQAEVAKLSFLGWFGDRAGSRLFCLQSWWSMPLRLLRDMIFFKSPSSQCCLLCFYTA